MTRLLPIRGSRTSLFKAQGNMDFQASTFEALRVCWRFPIPTFLGREGTGSFYPVSEADGGSMDSCKHGLPCDWCHRCQNEPPSDWCTPSWFKDPATEEAGVVLGTPDETGTVRVMLFDHKGTLCRRPRGCADG